MSKQQTRGRKRKQELKPRNETPLEIVQMDISPIDFNREQRSRSKSSSSSSSNHNYKITKTQEQQEQQHQQQHYHDEQEMQRQQQQRRQPKQAQLIMEDSNDDCMVIEQKPNVEELQREILRLQTANNMQMFSHQQKQQQPPPPPQQQQKPQQQQQKPLQLQPPQQQHQQKPLQQQIPLQPLKQQKPLQQQKTPQLQQQKPLHQQRPLQQLHQQSPLQQHQQKLQQQLQQGRQIIVTTAEGAPPILLSTGAPPMLLPTAPVIIPKTLSITPVLKVVDPSKLFPSTPQVIAPQQSLLKKSYISPGVSTVAAHTSSVAQIVPQTVTQAAAHAAAQAAAAQAAAAQAAASQAAAAQAAAAQAAATKAAASQAATKAGAAKAATTQKAKQVATHTVTQTAAQAAAQAVVVPMETSSCSTITTSVLADQQRYHNKELLAIEKRFYLTKPEIPDTVDLQETDSDEEGQSEINFGPDEFFSDEHFDDEELNDDYNPTWSNVQPPRRLAFQFKTDKSHLVTRGRHPKCIATPIYYFNLMLRTRKDFFTRLTFNCNLHAQQLTDANQIPMYLPLSTCETEIFIGLCLQMSQLKLPTIAEYFSDDKMKSQHFGFKGFNDKMSEQRFRYILRVINFDYLFIMEPNDYDTENMRGLKAIVAYFNKRMQELCVCDQRIIVKDPIVYWKGRLKRLDKMPEKFRLNSIHLHNLSVQNGFILKILPEFQTIENKLIKKNSRRLVEMRTNVVMQLLLDKLNQGHTVYVSKYYGSYALACELATRSTYCTGFLDRNRFGNSKTLLLCPMEPKTCQTRYAHSVLMGKYCKIEKSQYFFSSDCLAVHPGEMNRKKNDSRPKIITELDFQMNYSDKMRSYMEQYQLKLQKGEIKWEKCLFIYIINLMVFNAYVLYTKNTINSNATSGFSKLKTYPEFRQKIIHSLLQEDYVLPTSTTSTPTGASSLIHNKRRSVSVASHTTTTNTTNTAASLNNLIKQENNDEEMLFKEEEHFPSHKTNDDGKYLMKKCRICFAQIGLKTYTKHFCKQCPGQPGLCEEPCFKIWHSCFHSKANKDKKSSN